MLGHALACSSSSTRMHAGSTTHGHSHVSCMHAGSTTHGHSLICMQGPPHTVTHMYSCWANHIWLLTRMHAGSTTHGHSHESHVGSTTHGHSHESHVCMQGPPRMDTHAGSTLSCSLLLPLPLPLLLLLLLLLPFRPWLSDKGCSTVLLLLLLLLLLL